MINNLSGHKNNTSKLLLVIAVVFAFAGASADQKGTAEPDYYPMNYADETWTGEVTSANEATREFTLTYKRKDKDKTFVGVLPIGYKVRMRDGTEHEVKLEQLTGMRPKAYY